jgi:predicted RNA-binding Zn-ribbon protein involved in translation (DUF1610 family)
MALTLDFVHRYTRVPGSLEMRLVETNPYIRLRSGYEPPIFLQGGVAYDEGGAVVAQWPEWLQQAVAALTPAARAEAGFAVAEDPARPPAVTAAGLPPQPGQKHLTWWTCPECGETVSTRGKQAHRYNKHRKVKTEEPAKHDYPTL